MTADPLKADTGRGVAVSPSTGVSKIKQKNVKTVIVWLHLRATESKFLVHLINTSSDSYHRKSRGNTNLVVKNWGL